MVEAHGMGGESVGVTRFRSDNGEGGRYENLSPKQLEILDDRVNAILEEQRKRAEKIIKDNKQVVETLRDLLLEHKCIDAKRLGELLPGKKK